MSRIKNILRLWIWFIVLNLATNAIFTKPVSLWWLIEIVLFIISAVMVDWE